MESVEVTIIGQRYMIRGNASREYIRQLAEFVDARIKDIYRNSPGTTPLKASILAALMVSDELLKLSRDHDAVKQRIDAIESGAESLLNIME
jgi:cell division protein ZapA